MSRQTSIFLTDPAVGGGLYIFIFLRCCAHVRVDPCPLFCSRQTTEWPNMQKHTNESSAPPPLPHHLRAPVGTVRNCRPMLKRVRTAARQTCRTSRLDRIRTS